MSEEIKKQPREVLKKESMSYGEIVRRQFNKNRLAVWSLRAVYFIVFIGLIADFIANDKPIYAKIDGKTYFPILKQYAVDLGISDMPPELAKIIKWNKVEYDSVIFPPIPYSAATTDFGNAQYVGPTEDQRGKASEGRWKHWLGTDDLGRDVLSGMIHGTRIAMLVGVISMSISTLIGILLGSMAGYFGDNRLKLSRGRVILNLMAIPFLIFYAFISPSILLFILVLIIPNLLAWLFERIPFFAKRVNIPMDILVMRFIEILRSVPTLLLILAIIAVFKASIVLVMVIIGLTSWTGIARFIRGEMLKVRSLGYIEASEAMGFSRARIILKHAIPNSLTPVLIAIAFGVAGAILTESSLSFLGIGVPPETITWGKLLAKSRAAPEAWWLAIFPGLAIFLTVTIFNLLGDGLTEALDPKLKG